MCPIPRHKNRRLNTASVSVMWNSCHKPIPVGRFFSLKLQRHLKTKQMCGICCGFAVRIPIRKSTAHHSTIHVDGVLNTRKGKMWIFTADSTPSMYKSKICSETTAQSTEK